MIKNTKVTHRGKHQRSPDRQADIIMDTKNDTTTPERDERAAASALSVSHGSVSVPLKLLEELIEIACDYINPDGEKHHGVPPFNHGEACRVIREAGDIRDSFCKSKKNAVASGVASSDLLDFLQVQKLRQESAKQKKRQEARDATIVADMHDECMYVILDIMDKVKAMSAKSNKKCEQPTKRG